MTTKTTARRSFIGEWHIIDMELWGREDLDLMGPACLTLEREGVGAMRFIAVEANLDYRVAERDGLPAVEFSFEGIDEGDRISGRGWALLDEMELRGRLFFHNGDDSAFRATRYTARRRQSGR